MLVVELPPQLYAGPGVTTAFVSSTGIATDFFQGGGGGGVVLLVHGHLMQLVLQPVKLLVLVQHRQLVQQTLKVHYNH